ncbi:ribonuclease P protein component [Robiginitalea myxolifaciens]|uniref:Ribonuclease P protein component n=1 Tax=Robiginitalea myxolifaciens TaxID=400055 RepID=A0A1I6G3I0_9FLAO|nr:ribonuclease P protein component [Robiginitalea myxolifaciens]SFR36732.1 ribonuclease P protein component [Robiginitalea myxolifaciens]
MPKTISGKRENEMSGLNFPKSERLTHKQLWSAVFEQGKRLKSFPLQLYYLKSGHALDSRIQVGISVPKKRFPKAVDRNRIKRLLREHYRHKKQEVFNNTEGSYALVILYLGKELPENAEISAALSELIDKFLHHEASAKT